jgi:transportin-3
MAAQTHHLQQQQQQLCQAVQALFRGSDNTLRRTADEWIRNFQTLPEAWTVSQSALQDPNAGPEVHFIAAQTLNCKMRFDFADQLSSPTARATLRDSLFSLIIAHSNASGAGAGAGASSRNDPVVTQLALALAALALKMPEWETVFADVAQRLDSPQTLPVLLEVLQVIPEELGTDALDLPPEREDFLHRQIADASSHVLSYMVRCAGQCQPGSDEGELVLTRVYRCLAAWIEFGRIPPSELANCPLVGSAFDTIGGSTTTAVSSTLFNSAVALLIETFHR